ncbi:NAD-dependent epimerase/dehydratase family protein [Pelagibacteraceae bacterium]|nr:NAD-dependent epimerase/dehydratase family protein [Pelagibacteraceae bacterium]
MKKNFKLFCFGFGQVAQYFVKNLIKNKFNFDLITTNTKETLLGEFNGLKYKSFYFSGNNFDKDLLKELNSSNKVLISISPKNNIDIVLKTFDKNFRSNKFDWVIYLSATSVYGDKKGHWVNESTNLKPTSERGKARLNAENSWLRYNKNFNLPVQIFRLSGIYSLENNIIKRLKMGTLKVVKKTNHYFSRIHVEDIAQILTLSLKKNKPGEIFNISDNHPCSNEEIAKYAANLINVSVPKKIEVNEINSKMLKEFYNDSKKIDNKKMKDFFNYNLKYPTYKEGLQMIRNYKI